jgi:hypothetical protein
MRRVAGCVFGGEGGIRTLSSPAESGTYTFYVACVAVDARGAGGPCSILPDEAGYRSPPLCCGTSIDARAPVGLGSSARPLSRGSGKRQPASLTASRARPQVHNTSETWVVPQLSGGASLLAGLRHPLVGSLGNSRASQMAGRRPSRMIASPRSTRSCGRRTWVIERVDLGHIRHGGKKWLNRHHAHIRDVLVPLLPEASSASTAVSIARTQRT